MQIKSKFGCLLFAVAGVAVLLLAGTAWLGLNLRSQPAEKNQVLYEGVRYLRDTRQSPRPMVVHILKIDLRAEGIAFLVTPGDPHSDQPLAARTTSQFIEDFDVQLAVNGDGFTPWRSNGPLDYYPHPGDPVTPIGLAASRGTRYSTTTDNEPVLYISRANRARFNSPLGGVYNAISGNIMLVENGKSIKGLEEQVQPRTAVGLDKRQRTLIIVLVDGRQPNYSEGATLPELAQILIDQGAYTAMNLDGGGSTTLGVQTASGQARLLNSPIDQGIPGRERAIGNHLGVFARQAESQ